MSNHSSVPPVHPSAGLSSSIPSSSGVNLGNNLSSSGPLGASARLEYFITSVFCCTIIKCKNISY